MEATLGAKQSMKTFAFAKKLKYKNKFKPNAVAEVADLITLKHELKKQMIKLGI